MKKWSRFFQKESQPVRKENPVPPAVQKFGADKDDDEFYQSIENRRSIYVLSKDTVEDDSEILRLMELTIRSMPISAHAPSARIVLLLHDEHDAFWQLTREKMKSIMDYADFTDTQARLEMFEHAYGTILFFDDHKTFSPTHTKSIAGQYNGMLQYLIWVSLEAKGFGASLQHYNPMVNEVVKKRWDLPSNWDLVAQMPFGRPHEYPNPKEIKPLKDRVVVKDS
ncbi:MULTISPECIES: nitroreductase family protein [Bacillaceae]|uniref:nitroreductase family protein n=1 Tax=Shouchella oshimensis TaxID=290588 RepID=UPI0006EBF652|nr:MULTISPECIES: nitroreductase family protein [Bacillaceae]